MFPGHEDSVIPVYLCNTAHFDKIGTLRGPTDALGG